MLGNLVPLNNRCASPRNAFLVYVWDAAHNIEVDQPERMGSLVESFLERSDAFVVPYA